MDENLKDQGGENDKETVLSTTSDKGVGPSLLDDEPSSLNAEEGGDQEEGSIGDVDKPSNNRLAN